MNVSFTLIDLLPRAVRIRRHHAQVTTLLAGLLLAGAVQAQVPLAATLLPARNAHAAPRTTAVAVRFTQLLRNTAPTRQAYMSSASRPAGKPVQLQSVTARCAFSPT